jgi:hypothetical protein
MVHRLARCHTVGVPLRLHSPAAFLPASLLYFCSGKPMHFYSSVDNSSVFPKIRKARTAFVGSFSFFPEVWGADLLNAAVKRVNGEELPARISPRGSCSFLARTSRNLTRSDGV